MQDPPSAELGLNINRFFFDGHIDQLLSLLASHIVSNRVEVSEAALEGLKRAVHRSRAMLRH